LANPNRLERDLRALLDKLALDLAAADRRVAEVAEVLRASADADPDRGGVAIVAVALDHYYSSIEASLEMVGRVFDLAMPAGADWHRALLHGMRKGSATRPPVLASETADGLEDLLAFRHFLRHAYAADLEWGRMHNLALALSTIQRRVLEDMAAFQDYVKRCLGETERRS
jgi:hypothetical protein